MEMMLRHERLDPSGLFLRIAILLATTFIMLEIQIRPSPESCASHISMVTSIHKLLLIHSASVGNSSLPHSMSDSDLNQLDGTMCAAGECLMGVLRDVLEHRMATHQRGSASSQTRSTLASARGMSTTTGVHVADLYATSSAGIDGMRRLLSVLVMVLVWVSNVRVRIREERRKAGRWAISTSHIASSDCKDDLVVQDAELASIATHLSLSAQPADWGTRESAFKHEATVWDAFALRHFHGRLLPGCCYLRCTNMGGASEAALDTLLCSGCKHVRYCSVMCQREAWVLGGHAEVCGRGGWNGSSESI